MDDVSLSRFRADEVSGACASAPQGKGHEMAGRIPWIEAWRLRLAGLASAVALVTVLGSSAPSAMAANENFCGIVLAPFGQNGDRCWGAGHYIYDVNLVTYERAGCVDVANSNNELLQAWQCVGSTSSWSLIMEPTMRRKGVVRNNNVNNSGKFGGGEAWTAP